MDTLPTGQKAQSTKPLVLENRPIEQSSQLEDPATGWAFPAGQSSQFPAEGGENFPAAQEPHEEPSLENVPARQAVQLPLPCTEDFPLLQSKQFELPL